VGFVIHMLLALLVQGLLELAPRAPLEWPLAVLALACVPHALQAAARAAYLAGRFRAAARWQLSVQAAPLVLQLAAQGVFGWNASVERWSGTRPELLAWPHPALLAALAPFAVYTLAAIGARARQAPLGQRAAVVRFQARMFATGILPFAGFVLCAWAVGLDARLRVHLEEVGLFAAAAAAALFAAFLALMPWVVKRVWATRRLPSGVQRELLERLSRAFELRAGEIRVWDTGNQVSNAAVVGIGPGRVVLLSDALLAELQPRELAAVFAHEAAHVKRHHVLTFLCWSIAFFATADLASQWIGPERELAGGVILAVTAALWYLAFGWLSRRFELEADLWSAEATGDPAALASALERVGSIHGHGAGWRHFGTDQRVAFLGRAAVDPSTGPRLRATLARAERLGVAAVLVSLGLELCVLWGALGEDRLRAELRLGAYASAAERLADLTPGDAELERALQVVLALPAPQAPEDLLSAARGARQRGELALAETLAGLAVLRDAEPGDLRELLEAAEELPPRQ
jgi:Zn-dependent protease with chaperone function